MGVTDGSGNLVVKYGYDRYGSVTSTRHPAHAACRAGPPATSERSPLYLGELVVLLAARP